MRFRWIRMPHEFFWKTYMNGNTDMFGHWIWCRDWYFNFNWIWHVLNNFVRLWNGYFDRVWHMLYHFIRLWHQNLCSRIFFLLVCVSWLASIRFLWKIRSIKKFTLTGTGRSTGTCTGYGTYDDAKEIKTLHISNESYFSWHCRYKRIEFTFLITSTGWGTWTGTKLVKEHKFEII